MHDRPMGDAPMSNSKGLNGEPLSVADVIYESQTGRPFVPRPGGPRSADEVLRQWNTPAD